MDPPLISHPEPEHANRQYPPKETTANGELLLTAHSTSVAERATGLASCSRDQERVLWTMGVMHDFGKATPQFQAYIRSSETYDGPDAEKNHARLGAFATWFVLERAGVSDQDCLAATLAVARHHQALPNTAEYTAETLAKAVDGDVLHAQLNAIEDTWPETANEFFQLAIREVDPDEEVSWCAFHDWVAAGSLVDRLHDLTTEQELTGRYSTTANLPERLYDRLLHHWGALTLADKSHAMVISEQELFGFETLELDVLESYIADIRSSDSGDSHREALNDDRERARRQAIRGVHEWIDAAAPAHATLTLPTGLGKTFTGLSAGFEARELLSERGPRGESRPIIYALPYTSIIEQTRELFEDPDLWGADPRRSALTVHHYLSETVVVHGDHESGDTDATDQEDQAGLLGEAWRGGTVLTTFVQLFESITGPSNRQGLKLPALDSALVILDEPQALPKDWWDAIPRLLEILTGEFGARVISMTATQPAVVRELETISLLTAGRQHDGKDCPSCNARFRWSDSSLSPVAEEQYFDRAERVRYTLDETALAHQLDVETRYVGYEEAATRVREFTEDGGSTLAICNTIESSATLTEEFCRSDKVVHLGLTVRDCLNAANVDAANPDISPSVIARDVLAAVDITPPSDTGDGWSLEAAPPILAVTFNSRFRPFDRRVLIRLAELLSTAPVGFVMVATQAVEAGVDLTFRTVVRDIAPLDSIVQAAGRCNRSYEWGPNGGQVLVWTLADPEDSTPPSPTETPPATYVYERGATDAGIPGHLRLISDVLDRVGETTDIPDAAISRHAVDDYFERLVEKKSVASTEIREHIDAAEARWLSRQSLIGSYETVDVLVGVTAADTARIDAITDAFRKHEAAGYALLDEAAQLRVSLPVRRVQDLPRLPRVDGRSRGEEGAMVFRYTGGASLSYGFDAGGLQGTDDTVAGRFTGI